MEICFPVSGFLSYWAFSAGDQGVAVEVSVGFAEVGSGNALILAVCLIVVGSDAVRRQRQVTLWSTG